MYCQVCGADNCHYYPTKRRYLCKTCLRGTPDKVDRATFDATYWVGDAKQPPESIKREFYEDYLASKLTLAQYIDKTTIAI